MSSHEKEGISWREEFNVRNSLKGVRRAVRAKRGKLGLVKEYREEITQRPGNCHCPRRKPGACAHCCSDPVGSASRLLQEAQELQGRSSHWRCCCFCCKKPLSEPRSLPAVSHPGRWLLWLGSERGKLPFFFCLPNSY